MAEEVQRKMQDVIDHLKKDLAALRTGRANPTMLDPVRVEAYGTSMRLQDVASISTPESRQLLITPFDPQNIGAIIKGITAANLNLQPVIDGHIIRIIIPEMDASVRKKMQQQAKAKCEEAKVAIRRVRQEANKKLKDSETPEDVVKKTEKNIQELTDRFCKVAEDATHQKEVEIGTI